VQCCFLGGDLERIHSLVADSSSSSSSSSFFFGVVFEFVCLFFFFAPFCFSVELWGGGRGEGARGGSESAPNLREQSELLILESSREDGIM